MSYIEMMTNFLGTSGDAKLDFIVFALFGLLFLKLFLGLIRELLNI